MGQTKLQMCSLLTSQVFRGVCFPPWKRKRTLRNFYTGKRFNYQAVLHSIHKFPGIPTKPWIGDRLTRNRLWWPSNQRISLRGCEQWLLAKYIFCSYFSETRWSKKDPYLKLKFHCSVLFPVLFQQISSDSFPPQKKQHHSIIIQSFHPKRDEEMILLQTGSPNQVASDSNWTIIIHLTGNPW